MGARVLFLQLQVSAAVILILILRQGMKRLPKIYSYLLWILIFGRLLCPFSLESRIGIMPSLEEGIHWVEGLRSQGAGEKEPQEWEKGTLDGEEPGENMIIAKSEPEMGADDLLAGLQSGNPESAKRQEGEKERLEADERELFWQGYFNVKILIFLIWAAGWAGVLGYSAAAMAKVRRRLRNAGKLEEIGEALPVKGPRSAFLKQDIYVCEGIGVPFTMGVFRPRIYLPKGIEGIELQYILCHERVHVNRMDYLVKTIAFFLTAMNWFNPFVWAAFHFMENDMEMSCDENVVRFMGKDIKKQYSQSLLNFAAERGHMAMTPLTFGESNVKGRIKNVLSYKNAKKWSAVLGMIIIFAVGAALFTTKAEGAEKSGPQENPLQKEYLNEDSLRDMGEEGQGEKGGKEKDGAESQSQVYWSGDLTAWDQGQVWGDMAVEICAEGIYRGQGDQRVCLYSGYISPNVQWCDKDGILYFTMGADSEEDGEFLVVGIYMLDIKTGELDKKSLRVEAQIKDEDMYLLDIGEGFLTIYRKGRDVFIPLVNTGETPLTAGHTWKGKAVAELEEAERNAYGAAVREQLLSNPGLLLELSNRSLEETFALLDLDGDGKAERIVLSADPEEEPGYRPLDACRFQVEDSWLTGKAENLSNLIWAFSIDGSRIILALYSDGGGLDSRTILFTYEDEELNEIGSIPNDIRNCTIGEGRIEGLSVLYDAMMPLYMKVSYEINQNNELVQVSQEAYELICGDGQLLVDLPVHDSPSSEEISVMAPQRVQFIKIDSAYEWICLKGENGEEGWFEVGGHRRNTILELDMFSEEVFELSYGG